MKLGAAGRRIPAALLCAALGAGAVAALATGSDDEKAPGGGPASPAYLPGSDRQGAGGARSQVSEADCSQWLRASPRQRRAVIDEVAAYFRRVTRGGGGYALPPDEAYAGLERACENDWASAIKLWKIYERVLAFQYAP